MEVNRIALVCRAWHQRIVTKSEASLRRVVTVSGGDLRLWSLTAELEWWTTVEFKTGLKYVTDAEVMQVVIGCPGLITLSVCGCEDLTDASIKAVAKGCSRLTCCATGNTLFDDDGWGKKGGRCFQLKLG